jgi:hypothetical protein
MLLSNEAELLAMEAEKYSGINPIVVDNNNLTIGLDSGFIDAVSSISGAISAVSGIENKLDISAFTGYSAALDSGLSNAFDTIHNEITELQGDDSYLSGSIDYLSGVVTTGLSAYSAGPNINITDYVISGKDWLDTIQEASAYAAQQNPTSSTEWNEAYETLTSNSGVWNSVTSTQGEIDYVSGAVDNKLDFSAFSDVSGTFLTAHQPISANEWNDTYTTVQSNSGNWNDTYNTYSNNSASYLTDASQFYPMNSNPSGYLTEETDWTNTIKEASANAYNEATALIPPEFDPTYMSGAIDNKLDTTSFSDVSGTFLTAHQSLDGYATTAWVDSQGYLTAHQPISANEWNNVYDTVNVYSGTWSGSESSPTAIVDSNGSIDIVSSNNTVYFDVNSTWFNDAVNSAYTGSQGDANVNAYVHNNSATINNVNSTVQSNSSTWNTVNNKLDTTAFRDVSGTFLTAHQSLDGYATTAWVNTQGYMTEIPASAEETLETVNTNSSVWNSVTGKEDTISYGYSAGAISSINGSAILGETIPYEVYGISAGDNVTIWEENNTLWISAACGGQGGDEEVNNLVHSNSAIWDDVTNKLDTTAYVPFDPTYISGTIDNKLDSTAFNIPTSSNWNDVYNTVNSNSGLWSAGDTEVNNVVHNNSATWDSVTNKLDTTAFSDVSGSFLTAHQPISADEWNGTYETVQTNSASWGGGDSASFGYITINGVWDYIKAERPGYPYDNWLLNPSVLRLGPEFQNSYLGEYERVQLDKKGLSALSGFKTAPDVIWRAILNTDLEGYNNTISSINGSALAGGSTYTGDAQGALDEVYTNSGTWNDTYTNVQTNSGTWDSYGSDISYLSATIGDVESLLAQL